MPQRNPQNHTTKSVELVAQRLEKMLTEIRVSKSIMEEEPPLNSVDVEWQNALDVGLARMRTWTDALRDAVDNQRMKLASGGVSGTDGNSDKPRKKKP